MLEAANARRILGFRRTSRHPVKLTALYCLKEALLDEQYEDCAPAIEIALEFGAQEFEIKNLLEDPRRRPA